MASTALRIETNAAKLVERLDRKYRKVYAENLRGALRNSLIAWEAEMKRSQFVPYRGESPSNKLQRRSGALASSIRFRMVGRGFRSQGIGFTTSRYARIQELGGVVRGRPWLSIPLPDTLTSSGRTIRAPFTTEKSSGHWRTREGRTWIRRSQSGTPIVYGRVQGRVRALRVLKESVQIPEGRLGFFRVWKNQRAMRRSLFRKAFRDARKGVAS